MMKVQLKEKFNTAFGTVLLVNNDHVFRVAEKIQTSDGDYIIRGINFPTKPDSNDVGLVVEKA